MNYDEIYVMDTKVECGGNKSEANHPRIFLEIDTRIGPVASTTCPYCSKKFILKRN